MKLLKWIFWAFVIVIGISLLMPSDPPTEAEKREAKMFSKASDVRIACRKHLKQHAKFKSKVEIKTIDAGPSREDSSTWYAKGTADLMNGFGAMIPHTFVCKYQSDALVDFAVAPGG